MSTRPSRLCEQAAHVVERAVAAAGGRRRAQAEVYAVRAGAWSVEYAEGRPERVQAGEQSGFGIRVIVDGRPGFTCCASEEVPEAVISRAVAAARRADRDGHCLFPAGHAGSGAPARTSSTSGDLHIEDPRLRRIPAEEKMRRVAAMSEAARKVSPKVKRVLRSAYGEEEFEVAIVNSHGLLNAERGTHCSCSVECIAESGGDTEVSGESHTARQFSRLEWDRVARTAAERAARLVGGRPAPGGRKPVVFDSRAFCELLDLAADGLCADAVLEGRTPFPSRVGGRVAAEGVTLVDDGRLPGGAATSWFDDEGVPTRRTTLIQGGRLAAFLYDASTAHRGRAETTGSGSRGSFRGLPAPGTSNLFLVPGTSSTEDLLKAAEGGLYIVEMMGLHMADPISGEFSLGVSGFRIERGRLGRPVRGMTVAGTVRGLLESVSGIGRGLVWHGSTGSPPVLVRGLTFS